MLAFFLINPSNTHFFTQEIRLYYQFRGNYVNYCKLKSLVWV
jgi:hypothetical protein